MALFKRKKKEEVVVDPRTEIERTFEEKGQALGKKAGELVQKGKDGQHSLSGKLLGANGFDCVFTECHE